MNPAPAEEALLTAIAVAKRQGTRSFELRAAFALAKLYRSTARPAEAHAVLAPALEGFAPSPEMPEIAEAQACSRRCRRWTRGSGGCRSERGTARTKKRVDYGSADQWAKGWGRRRRERRSSARRTYRADTRAIRLFGTPRDGRFAMAGLFRGEFRLRWRLPRPTSEMKLWRRAGSWKR